MTCWFDVPTIEVRNSRLTSFQKMRAFNFVILMSWSQKSNHIAHTVIMETTSRGRSKFHPADIMFLLISPSTFLYSLVMTLLESSAQVTENCPEDRASSMSTRWAWFFKNYFKFKKEYKQQKSAWYVIYIFLKIKKIMNKQCWMNAHSYNSKSVLFLGHKSKEESKEEELPQLWNGKQVFSPSDMQSC